MKSQSASTGNRTTLELHRREETRPPRIWRALLVAGVALVGVLIAATGHLEVTVHTIVPRCPTNAWLGLYCPACGTTRAFMRLLQGDLPGALHYNPLAVLLLPLLTYVFILGTDLGARKWPRWQVVALITAIFAYTLLRNLPFWPWILLAPPQ